MRQRAVVGLNRLSIACASCVRLVGGRSDSDGLTALLKACWPPQAFRSSFRHSIPKILRKTEANAPTGGGGLTISITIRRRLSGRAVSAQPARTPTARSLQKFSRATRVAAVTTPSCNARQRCDRGPRPSHVYSEMAWLGLFVSAPSEGKTDTSLGPAPLARGNEAAPELPCS